LDCRLCWNVFFPKTIDVGPKASFINAVLIDTLLLGLFSLQHSIMARSAFKQWWTRIIPSSIERSTYVVVAGLLLLLLYWQWLPIPGVVWNVEQTTGDIFLRALS
jgi:protein-S-isoprenylcysteine O-methyltransferase Ste14